MANDTYITMFGALFQKGVKIYIDEADKLNKKFADELRRELNSLGDIPQLSDQLRARKIVPSEIVKAVKRGDEKKLSATVGAVWVIFAMEYWSAKERMSHVDSLEEYKSGRAAALSGGGKNPFPVDVFGHYVWNYGFSSVFQDGQSMVYGTRKLDLL
jgi:hypothetical protein